MIFLKTKKSNKEMLQEILKTIEAYRLVNCEVLSKKEADGLDKQIQFLQEQLSK